MPSSRSAKEICAQYGEGSMDCRVARAVEKDRPPRTEEAPTPPPAAAEPPAKKRSPFDRAGQLADAEKKLGL